MKKHEIGIVSKRIFKYRGRHTTLQLPKVAKGLDGEERSYRFKVCITYYVRTVYRIGHGTGGETVRMSSL
jgi:hypothetical protein